MALGPSTEKRNWNCQTRTITSNSSSALLPATQTLAPQCASICGGNNKIVKSVSWRSSRSNNVVDGKKWRLLFRRFVDHLNPLANLQKTGKCVQGSARTSKAAGTLREPRLVSAAVVVHVQLPNKILFA